MYTNCEVNARTGQFRTHGRKDRRTHSRTPNKRVKAIWISFRMWLTNNYNCSMTFILENKYLWGCQIDQVQSKPNSQSNNNWKQTIKLYFKSITRKGYVCNVVSFLYVNIVIVFNSLPIADIAVYLVWRFWI